MTQPKETVMQLLELAGRADRATANHEWAVIREVGSALFGIDDFNRSRLNGHCDQGGFIEAAMICLPSGWRVQHLGQSTKFDRWCAQIYNDGCDERYASEDDIAMVSRTGNTAALAVLHAALRARAGGQA